MTKQNEISRFLKTVPFANIEKIYKNVSFSYHCNEHKYLGEILSRMVKNGQIERIKKGTFRYVTATEYIDKMYKKLVIDKQPKLF